MLTEFLSIILTTEWQGSVAVVAVLALCWLLRRNNVTRRFNCLLWLVVLVRLLWAGSISIPLPKKHAPAVMVAAVRMSELAAPHLNELEPTADGLTEMGFLWRKALLIVWCLGVAVMAGYTLVSCAALQRRLSDALRYKPEGCIVSERIETAFVWGLFRPCICLPAGLSAHRRTLMILHEQTHIRRGDHWRKAFFWLAVCLHWWNPLVWLAFKQMSRDMEAACDEAVLRQLDKEERADYCQSLLDLARRKMSFCPPAFDGSDVRERVRHILAWKLPTRRATVLALAFCLVMGSALLIHPVAESADASPYPTEPVIEAVGPEKNAESGLFLEATPAATPEQGQPNPQGMLAPIEESEQPEMASEEIPPAELPQEPEAFMTENEPAMEVEAEAPEEAVVVCTEVGENGFVWPVPASTHVSRWMDDSHKGADIAAASGSEIVAMADGIVAVANKNHFSYGNFIIIDHDDMGETSYRSLYAHCDTLLVKEGDHVTQGQLIATVGCTGYATGNICHLELYRDGTRFSLHDLFPSM